MTEQPTLVHGPYDYFVGNANGRGLIRIEASHSSPDAGTHIASMPRGKQSETMAAFITNACNTHNDLVEALTIAKGGIEELCIGQHPENECWNTLRTVEAALQKAHALHP